MDGLQESCGRFGRLQVAVESGTGPELTVTVVGFGGVRSGLVRRSAGRIQPFGMFGIRERQQDENLDTTYRPIRVVALLRWMQHHDAVRARAGRGCKIGHAGGAS